MDYPDKAIRDKILESSDNVMISAGAGAGKTEIMAKAVIQRLLRDKDLKESEIVMITFTNAAAAELKNRIAKIYRNMQEAADKEALSRRIDLDAIHISTIHSFCSSLILQKVFDCDYGISPAISEKGLDKDDPRISSFIKHYFNKNKAENGAQYEQLYSFWDYQTDSVFVNTLGSLAPIDELEVVIPDKTQMDTENTKKSIKEFGAFIKASVEMETGDLFAKTDLAKFEKTLCDVITASEEELSYYPLKTIIDNLKDVETTLQRRSYYSIYKQIIPIVEDCHRKMESEGMDIKTAKGARAKLTDTHISIACAALKEMQKILKKTLTGDITSCFGKSFVDNYNNVVSLSDLDDTSAKKFFSAIVDPAKIRNNKNLADDYDIPYLSDDAAKKLVQMKKLAGELFDYYVLQTAWVIKDMYEEFDNRERPEIDSNGLLRLAAGLVCGRNGKENCRYFSRKYKVFFVDEFQDTDYLQLKIVTALASDEDGKLRKGSLFLVGDPKQSIYRFRGAEVGFYEYIRKTCFSEDDFYELTENFRSEKTLVDKVNSMYREPFENMSGYTDMNPHNSCKISETPESDENGKLILRPGNYDMYSMNEEKIVQLVSSLMSRKFYVCENGNTISRKVKYGDILVITRANKPASRIAKLLKKAGYPVLVAGEVKPSDITAMQRLRALMRYLENSSSMRLAELCTAFVPEKAGSTSGVSFFSRFTYEQADKLFEIIEEGKRVYYGSGALETIYAAIKNGWLFDSETGVPDIVSELPMLYEFLENISGHAINNIKTVNTFIDEFMNSKFKNQLEPAEQSNCIRVMNLHQTKGLEGNIVISLITQPMSFSPGAVIDYIDKTTGGPVEGKPKCYPALIIGKAGKNRKQSKIALYDKIIQQNAKDQDDQEKVRLNYVRDTRAAYILINANTAAEKVKSSKAKKDSADNNSADSTKTAAADDNNAQDAVTGYDYAAVAKALAAEGTASQAVQLLEISPKTIAAVIPETFDSSISPSLLEKSISRNKEKKDDIEEKDKETAQAAASAGIEPDDQNTNHDFYQQDDADEKTDEDPGEINDTDEQVVRAEGALYGTIMHRAFELFFENKKTGRIMDEAGQEHCIDQAMLESLDMFPEDKRVPAVLTVYRDKLRSNMKALIGVLKAQNLYDLPAATETPFYCIVDAEKPDSSDNEDRRASKQKLAELISKKVHKRDRNLRRVYFSGKSDLTLFADSRSFIVDYKSDKPGYTREQILNKYGPQQECYGEVAYLFQNMPGYKTEKMTEQTLFAPNAFEEDILFKGKFEY